MKILFTDLDGTLLTTGKRISDTDLSSINKMIDAGHHFVISSGRPLPSVLKLANEFNLIRPGFYVSCFNGSVIYDCYNQKMLQRLTVAFEDVQYIFDEAQKEGLHVHTYSDEAVISAKDTEEYRFYLSHIHMPGIVSTDFKAYMDHEPSKIIVMSFESRDRLIRFQKEHAPYTDGRLNFTYSCDFMLEYASLQGSKGNALLAMCQLLGIPVSDSIAIGDEQNDLSMICAAGLGVVMANGNDSVKEYADYVTHNDNDHNAITEIIEKFIL